MKDKAFKLGIIVGRFQTFHTGHLDMVGKACAVCDRVGILRDGRLIDIKSMEDLRENGYKKITLTARKDIPKDFFLIPGVADLNQNGNTASFLFRGNTMTIMEHLHQLALEDILIERPSLEEIFLHYYEQEVKSC